MLSFQCKEMVKFLIIKHEQVKQEEEEEEVREKEEKEGTQVNLNLNLAYNGI